MTRQATWSIIAVLLASLMFQGYQCGSPEFTGAKVYIQQKNYDEAIRLLETETEKNPGNEEAWFLLGQLRAEKGLYVPMNVAFNEALKLGPKHAKEIQAIRFNRWATHLNAGVNALQRASQDSMEYYDRSIEQFTRSRDAWPDTMITYRYLGYAHSGKGDEDGAIEAFTMAWTKGRDTESYKQAGRIYLDRGKKLKRQFEAENADKLRAVANLKQVEKGMAKGDVMRLLGAPDNVKKGPRGSTKEEWSYTRYNLQVTVERDRVTERSMTAPYNPNIDSSMHKGAMTEFAKSVELFEAVKKVDPRDNQNLNLLLDGYVQADKIREAIEGFRQAVDNEPSNKLNHYILGVLHRTAGNFDAAIASFRSALTIDENYADALFDLGATYYNWGVDMIRASQESGKESTDFREKFEQAVPHLERVTTLKKNDASVWETLGTIYARLGDSTKAMHALDQADKIRKGN